MAHRSSFLLSASFLALMTWTNTNAQWVVVDTSYQGEIRLVVPTSLGSYFAFSGYSRRSFDNGSTWDNVLPTSQGFPLGGIWRDAYFTDADHGIMVGAFELDANYAIVRTDDGGVTWDFVDGYGSGDYPRRINEVDFPESQTGYACGSNGVFWKSTDAGITWAQSNVGSTEWKALHFWSPTLGILAGDGVVQRTTDGGASWTPQVVGDEYPAVDAKSDGRVYLACNGAFLTSSDFGLTWTSRDAPIEFATDVIAVDSTTILVCTRYQGMLISHSGGAWWERLPYPANQDFNDMLATGPESALAVGFSEEDQLIISTDAMNSPGIPIPTFELTGNGGCGQGSVSMVSTSDPVLAHSWTVDGSIVGNGLTASVGGLGQGSHSIWLVVDNGTYQDSTFASFTVSSSALADAGPDQYVCHGHHATLSGSGIGSLYWQLSNCLSTPGSATTDCICGDSTRQFVLTAHYGSCYDYDTVTVFVGPDVHHEPWETVVYSQEADESPSDGQMVDPANGFAFGYNGRRTHDGGATWSDLGVFVTNGPGSLSMLDPFNGSLCAEWGLLRTTDGWQSYDLVPHPMNEVVKALSIGPEAIYALCHGGNIGDMLCFTSNGGLSWDTLLALPYGHNSFDMTIMGPNTIIVGYNHWPNSVGLARSFDGGGSWVQTDLDTTGYREYNELSLSPGGSLFAAGKHSQFGMGVFPIIARSSDLGSSWSFVDLDGLQVDILDIEFLSADTGYASTYRGMILKTEDGGDCWVSDADTLAGYERSVALFGGAAGGMFVMATAGNEGGTKIIRTDPSAIPQNLGFAMSDSTGCAGMELQLASQCLGYDSLQWFVDGAYHGNAPLTTLEFSDPGTHSVLLLAFLNGDADQMVHTILVDGPLPAPVAESLGATCWEDGVAILVVSGVPNAETFHWQENFSLLVVDYAPVTSDTAFLSFANASDSLRFQVRAESPNGCVSPWSEPVTFALPEPPDIGPISGPDPVCAAGVLGGVDALYQCDTVPGALGYNWNVTNGGGSIISEQPGSVLIHWELDMLGEGIVSRSTELECGHILRTRFVELLEAFEIITQPVSVVVQVGEPLLIGLELSGWPSTTGQWFHGSEPLTSTMTLQPSYFDPVATAADTGWYHWELDMGICGLLVSDSFHVALVQEVGFEEPLGDRPVITLRPMPASDELIIQGLPDHGGTRLFVHDALGRRSFASAVVPGPAHKLDVRALTDGFYTLEWRHEDSSGSIPFIIRHAR